MFYGGKVVELEVDQPLRSLPYYQRLAASGKGTLSTQLNLTLALEQAGRFDDALKALAPVLEKLPNVADLWLQEASLRYRSGDQASGKAAFAKALDAAPEKDRPGMKERIASLLGSLGQYAESADQYAAMARAADKVEDAQRLTSQAASYYQNAGQAQKGWPLWEELLKRWPNDARIMAAAGMFAAYNGQFERGVELIRSARKLNPKVECILINAYVQRGMRDEAIAEFREVVVAANANQVYGALANLSGVGQQIAAAEALKLLGADRTAAQITGATQYLHSYSALRDKAGVETLLAAVRRKDFPGQARMNVFYALQNVRQQWGGLKLEPPAVLAPLCENPQTDEEWNLAAQALNALTSYGFHKEALAHLERLLQRKDVPESARPSFVQTEFSALNGLGRQQELGAKALQALAAAKDEHSAYQPAWQAFHARLNRNDIEGAAQVAEAYAQRFPNAQYLPQFYSYLMQRLQQNEKKGEAAALVEKLAKAYPQNPLYLEMRARMLASQGKFRDAAESVRGGIKALSAPAPETVLPAPIHKEKKEEKPAEPAKKADEEETRREEAKQRAEQRRAQRGSLINLLAQLCAQDAELRAAFLKEAEANAKGEDPAFREWTEAALACVNAAGDVDAYLKRLRALAQSEPNDPLWARRFGFALLSNRKYEAARTALVKLSDADPDDVELALSLQGVCELLKDAPAAEKYFARAFDALSRHPNQLQQYAQQWQHQKPEWSLKAWLRLKDDAKYGNGAYAAYYAAQVCQQLGREKDAAELFFWNLSSGDGNYASSALQSLVSLAQKEEILRAASPLAHKAMEGKPEGVKAVFLNLLVYNLEKLRAGAAHAPASIALDSPAALARAALDNVVAFELPQHDYSTGQCIVAALVQEGLLDRAEKYALEGGGKLNPDARRNLIRQTAQSYFSQDKSRAAAIRLTRSLLANPDQNSDNDRRRLVELLVQDGQLAAAEAELRAMPVTQHSWAVYESWQRVVEVYRGKKDHARALTLALDAWQVLENDPSYGSSACNEVAVVCEAALHESGKLDDALRKRATEKIRESAGAYFTGEAQRGFPWLCNRGDLLEKLGLRDDIAAMVREAGASDDPRRVVLAAAHMQNVRDQVGEAKRLYRRALTLPGADERNILSQLYHVCAYQYGNQKPDWGDAIELLEKLKTLNVYNEEQYMAERGRCLYGLKRPDEAREIYRKLLASPTYWRQGYWQMQNLAHQFEQDKDWTMATEAWELAIKLLRRQSRGQIDANMAVQFYQACAQAYGQLGDKDKALDCFLRGMSVIPRNNSYYQQILDAALKQVLHGEALDKAVEDYEKSVASSGGAERPHLRIAFADGYRKANNPRKMLYHLGIASNLLPKDTQLRQQVIDGYKQLGDNEGALSAYCDWAKFDPQNIEVYRAMGDLYQSLGRQEEALLAWATMAEIRPREAEGYRAYAGKLTQVGQVEAAAVALRHAIRYRPTEFDISKELADVYRKLGQGERIPALWTAGETECRKAMEDFADDPLPWLNLGRFLGAQNKTQEERDLYGKILQRQWPRFQRETHDDARKRLQEMK
ncbi:MAG: hypothetical protein NTW87_23185 [Planctomycetota bacterium]|nr:hypothetical protein [Planctomycetota bacterium]